MKLHNNKSRYNRPTILLLENTDLHANILEDMEKGYSKRMVASRNGLDYRRLMILLRFLGKAS